jgi:uncharacterized protein YbdZ (MbtH family)
MVAEYAWRISMTWDVLQNALGELQLIPTGDAVPDGWTLVAVTANPDYLAYMAEIAAGG